MGYLPARLFASLDSSTPLLQSFQEREVGAHAPAVVVGDVDAEVMEVLPGDSHLSGIGGGEGGRVNQSP